MNIAYYMPLKPMGHPHPSGDLITGTEIHAHLEQRDHRCRLISSLRTRWLYLNPLQWPLAFAERRRALATCVDFAPDIWLTYHSYYKAPDLLGPYCARKLNIPYVIFQGIYSTKRRRHLKTLPGFLLNRHALRAADLIFTNKRRDLHNLRRLLAEERIVYLPPGINPGDFRFDGQARTEQRQRLHLGEEVVIMTTAMFRPGVKTKGIRTVIEACAALVQRGRKIKLLIAGDGMCRQELEQLAAGQLPDRTLFLGRVERSEMAALYSSADIFAFPGIEESLGMVYLEAQACNLPVVAFGDWGASEAVIDGQTGLLSTAAQPHLFIDNLDRLITNRELRRQLGAQGAKHIHENHDGEKIYNQLERKLTSLTRPLPH